MKILLALPMIFVATFSFAQKVESFGMFGGFSIPITIDQGLNKDLRYYSKFTLRSSPFGFSYGYDHVGYGFLFTPQYVKVGQKFIIQNTVGGEVGTRDVQMNYFSLPAALKLHVTDMAFFRFSVLAAINIQYLLKGQEVITHSTSKLKYPSAVIVPGDPGYVAVYDGVFVPEVNKQVYVSNDKFKALQLFAAVGFHSDYEISDEWSIDFDGRANFGIFDPRKNDYLTQLKQPANIPDVYGQRREVYLSGTIGISRIFQIKENFKSRSSKGKTVGNKFFGSPRNKKKAKK
jgi:hypothetical protein